MRIFREPLKKSVKQSVPSPFMGEGQDGGERHQGLAPFHPHPNPPPSRGRELNQSFLSKSDP